MIAVHIAFLAAVVVFSHHAIVFLALFLFFLGFTEAYPRYQSRLMIREGLMVAFFLAGLVVLGGQQKWWLQPLLADMGPTTLYFGATLLTAITDNAALTYLGSLVDGVSERLQVLDGGGRGDRRRADSHRQCAQSGRLRHPQGQLRGRLHRRARPTRGSDTADARCHCRLPTSPRVSAMVSLASSPIEQRTAEAASRALKVLAVIDGTERTGRIIDYALRLKGYGQSLQLVLLGVVPEPPTGRLRGYGTFKQAKIYGWLKEDMRQRAVSAVARRLDQEKIAHVDRVEVGDPIGDYPARRPRGGRGTDPDRRRPSEHRAAHATRDRPVLATVTSQVVQRATVPVVVLK